MNNRLIRVFLTVLIGVLSLVVGCAPAPAAQQAAQKTAIKIGYIGTDSFAALFLAADRYLPGEGFEVEMVKLPSGAEILSQVATGQLQMGGGGLGAATFNAAAEGLPVKVVAPLHEGKVEDYFTVRKAAWGSEITRIADLKGKPVGLNTRGAAVEWILDQALRRDGLTIRDVEIKIMPFPDMVPALESGAISAGIVSEPFPTLAEQRGAGVRPLEPLPGAKPVPITMVFWNTDWAKNNEAAAKRFMTGYLKAARDLALNNGWQREDNLQVIAKYAGADLEVLKKARPHHLDPNLEVDRAVLEANQRFNMEYGYLKYQEPLPLERVFDLSYLEQALRDAGRK
jgi:NitT/TauT family transport system substrate-binding protein